MARSYQRSVRPDVAEETPVPMAPEAKREAKCPDGPWRQMVETYKAALDKEPDCQAKRDHILAFSKAVAQAAQRPDIAAPIAEYLGA